MSDHHYLHTTGPLSPTTTTDLCKYTSAGGRHEDGGALRTVTSIRFSLPVHPNKRRIDRPFTPEELERALRRTNLEGEADPSGESISGTPSDLDERMKQFEIEAKSTRREKIMLDLN